MKRSVRWLDRCIEKHKTSGNADKQNLFAIVQGGLDPKLRDQCLDEMVKRKDGVAGFAVGGLSGGEAKGKSMISRQEASLQPHFIRYILENVLSLTTSKDYYLSPYRIKQCTDKLPEDRKAVNSASLWN